MQQTYNNNTANQQQYPQPYQPRSSHHNPNIDYEEEEAYMEPWERCCRKFWQVTFCSLVILAVIGGVSMIAVGGSKIGNAYSTREEKVNEYNTHIKNYGTQSSYLFAGANASVAQVPSYTEDGAPVQAKQVATPIRLLGSNRGVSADGIGVESTLLSAAIHPYLSNVTELKIRVNNETTTRTIAFSKVAITPIQCSEQSCSSNCDKWNRVCTKATLLTTCKTLYNQDATYVGSDSCEKGDQCGSCHYPMFLESVCIVVDDGLSSDAVIVVPAGKLLRLDNSMQSCYYPFTANSHLYTTTMPPKVAGSSDVYSASIAFQFRVSQDPFVVLQRITQGTMHFGQLPEEQFRGSFIVIGIGIGLIVAFTCGMCCYMMMCGGWCRRRHHAPHRRANVEPIQPHNHAAVAINPVPGQAPMVRSDEAEMVNLPPARRNEQPQHNPIQYQQPRPQQPVEGILYINTPQQQQYTPTGAQDVDEVPAKQRR